MLEHENELKDDIKQKAWEMSHSGVDHHAILKNAVESKAKNESEKHFSNMLEHEDELEGFKHSRDIGEMDNL